MNQFQSAKDIQSVSAGSIALSSEAIEATMRQKNLVQSVEAKRIAATIILPTREKVVIERLRKLEQPATFFGETPGDRRERLRLLMAEIMSTGRKLEFEDEKEEAPGEQKERKPGAKTFYSEGSNDLQSLRRGLITFSLTAAKARIAKEKSKFSRDSKLRKKGTFAAVSGFESQMSAIGDSRALSSASISADGRLIACGSWSGDAKVWALAETAGEASLAEGATTFSAHSRVTDVEFAPYGGEGCALVACDVTGHVSVWDAGSSRPLARFRAHNERLSKIAFVPFRKNLAVVGSFDKTWSLFDVSAEKCFLRQEGHADAVYAVAVHPDSSLVLTGDLSGIARVWDLRTGHAALNLRGHSRQVLCADFADNGVQAATGSGDNTVKIWDLRGKSLFYSIPAHFGEVTAVKFQRGDGDFLVTASFDKTLRLWSAKTFALLKTLTGHEDKVTDCALSPLDGSLYSCSFDRTLKRWNKGQ